MAAESSRASVSSDSYFDNICEPCSKLGKTCEAESFCLDCQENLCSRCSAYHKVQALTKNHDIIGIEDKRGCGVTAKFVAAIETKTGVEDDFFNTGLALLPNNVLVVADKANRKLKIRDTSRSELISEFGLPAFPHDVAKTSADTVAVTVPDKRRILLVRIVPRPSIVGGFDVAGACSGVSYNSDKGWLAVSFTVPKKVEIMDLTGHVIRLIDTVGGRRRPFVDPDYVTFSPDNKVLYVCEHDESAAGIVKLGLDGTTLATYDNPHNMLCLPNGIIAARNTDNIFIAGYGVQVLSPDFRYCKNLLSRGDHHGDFQYPFCLSLNEIEDLLYVGLYGSSKILVFKLRYCRRP